MKADIVYSIKELKVTLSNSVRSKVQKLIDSKILTVYRGQGNDEMKYDKICALMDEVARKEDSFLLRTLTVFY